MASEGGSYRRRASSADTASVSTAMDSEGSDMRQKALTESAEGKAVLDVLEIEPYSPEKIMSLVEIAPAPGKGRCMFVRHSYEPGGLILVERPLFVILPDSNRELWTVLTCLNERKAFQLSPLWHQAAMVTILTGTKEKLDIMRGKWVLDRNPQVSEDVYRILEATCVSRPDGTFVYSTGVIVDPKFYQFLLQVWPLNAFGHSSDPNGLVIYNKISYLAHSCDATACWHHFGDDYFMLRSRRRLRPGDELTISYLGESDLLSPTHKRRELLQNWSFQCRCTRCMVPVDSARGFLCKRCHYGRVAFYEDEASSNMVSAPCTLCEYRYTAEEIGEYIELERAYMERLEGIDTTDLLDIQQVYNHARHVFKQHWCLYQLQTLLFDCYKDRGEHEMARYYLQQRIYYADAVMLRPLYCVAFMYEEFADMLMASVGIDLDDELPEQVRIDVDLLNTIMDLYFRAGALLAVLSGYHHSYYYAVARVVSMRCVGYLRRRLRCLFCFRRRRNQQLDEFKECCQLVAIKRAGGQLPDEDFWNLYGYFKQTVVGDFNVKETEDATEAEKRKWASWKKHRGMSKKEAMTNYIAIVRNLYGHPDSGDSEMTGMSINFSRPKVRGESATISSDAEDLFSRVVDNQVGLVNILLKEHPHLLHVRSPEGLTALHLAADRGHVEMVRCLLDHGAELDAVDDNNDTPLLVAAAAENREVVNMLLREGADSSIRNSDDRCMQDLLENERQQGAERPSEF
ncbi:apical complex lysine methyltransferase [Babesia caballi]|uniref:Apical complex lysine methyltransferase n=1 Tax=Babesia caballi TaxID=5871 RepID=A0AAV4LS94_BABCB|nr:apical complex lysine methyltransferase [Babesia caballi]